MNARNVQTRIVRAGRLMRAFTLIEMLICVGAVALIAVGLGKLFSSTGATVRIGKQISNFNEVAATLERQIRKDLASATRDGPMVIRCKRIQDPTNPYVNADPGLSNPVYLTGEKNPVSARVRRADGIMFLAQGKFTSAREPQWPGRAPASSAARIYFGHGMKRDRTYTMPPKLSDDPGPTGANWPEGLGQPKNGGGDGANEFASDWILLRHVTALARPQQTQIQRPMAAGLTLPPYLNTDQQWQDSPVQIGLQPAAPSVFRFDPANVGEADADRLGFGYEKWVVGSPAAAPAVKENLTLPGAWARQNDVVAWPQTESGIVDVASIDPQMIRTRILGVPNRLPWDASSDAARSQKIALTSPNALRGTNYNNPGNANTYNAAHLMKMMMAGMLPDADPWVYSNGAMATAIASAPGQHVEQRMICAAVPPDFTGNLSGAAWNSNEPYHQQDEAMLSASNFAVGCSEFKVEWSFGDVYPVPAGAVLPAAQAQLPGQIIWHDIDAPYLGAASYNNGVNWPNIGSDQFKETWLRADGTTGSRTLPADLVHWPTNYRDKVAQYKMEHAPLYSFFGYLDPVYVAGAPGSPDIIEWPWPKLLRFTISLTDPTDPSVEQTFQFVVDLPAANRRQ